MSRWKRVQWTLQQPAYRIRLAFFLILGFAAALLAVLLRPRFPLWSEVLLEFAVTIGAVGVLQLLWDFLGGDPVEFQIGEVQDAVENLGRSITVLSDLVDGDIGVERVWRDRQSWEQDSADGKEVWYERVGQAREIDIMSNTLWNNWMHREKFRKKLFDNIAQGAHVRILIYDPDSDVLELRAADEEDRFFVVQHKKVYEMQTEINSTLSRVAEGRSRLSSSARTNLEVRLTTQTLHPAQMIRADERMVVAIYLSGKSGTPSPTMQIRGSESSYFHKYTEQFDTLWKRARPLSDDRFSQILQDYGHLPTPPAEDSEHSLSVL